MIKCTSCGFENNEINKFCEQCGSKLEQKPKEQFCRYCGKQLEPAALFCTSCGKRIQNLQGNDAKREVSLNVSQTPKKKKGGIVAVV